MTNTPLKRRKGSDTAAFSRVLRERSGRTTEDDKFIKKSGFDFTDPAQVIADEGRLERLSAEAH